MCITKKQCSFGRLSAFLLSSILLCFALWGNAQKSQLHGDVTGYVGFASLKRIEALGYASIYNTKNHWQIRYNYEASNTVSFFWGRPLNKKAKKFEIEVVPSVGVSMGDFTGFSPALHIDAEIGKFEFYTSSQYSFCALKPDNSFFFSWSEVLYTVADRGRLGLALQYTKDCPTKSDEIKQAPQQIDFGPVGGVEIKRFYLSAYLFNLWSAQRHYAFSLTYNF